MNNSINQVWADYGYVAESAPEGFANGTTPFYPITNSIIFNLVMQDEDILKEFLERIFRNRKVKNLKITQKLDITNEATLLFHPESKFIRLDLLFEGESEWLDVEMQCWYDPDLPKRMRYYGSMMDVVKLEAGDAYSALKDSFVIFICDYDHFRLNRPIYSFSYEDAENHLQLKDGSYKIIVNAACDSKEVPDSLSGLLNYIHTGVTDITDPLVVRLDSKVKETNRRREVSRAMTLYEDFIYRENLARKQGKEEGFEEGRLHAAFEYATAMKKEGLDISLISKVTGLTTEQIEAI